MKRIIIIREVEADEEGWNEASNQFVINLSHSDCPPKFSANRKLLLQKFVFCLTAGLISFTHHGLYCDCSFFDLENIGKSSERVLSEC